MNEIMPTIDLPLKWRNADDTKWIDLSDYVCSTEESPVTYTIVSGKLPLGKKLTKDGIITNGWVIRIKEQPFFDGKRTVLTVGNEKSSSTITVRVENMSESI